MAGTIGSVLGTVGGSAIGGPIGGQIGGALGGAAGNELFGGGGGGGGGSPTVFKTPTYRIDPEAGAFKLSRRPQAEAKGGLSSASLIRKQGEIDTGLKATLDSQRAFRSGLSDLRTRIQALSPDFQSLRDTNALFRAGTEEDFGAITDKLLSLQGEVRPGFSALRKTITDSISNRRDEAVGNLRAQLSRRRVLGSSFGEDAQSRVQREFSQLEEEALADASIAEIQQSKALIESEANVQAALASIIQGTLNFDLAATGAEFDAGVSQLGLELGLEQTVQQGLRDELGTIQAQQAAFQQIIDRELEELRIVGNIGTGNQSLAASNAQFDALLAARAATESGKAAGAASEKTLEFLSEQYFPFGRSGSSTISGI